MPNWLNVIRPNPCPGGGGQRQALSSASTPIVMLRDRSGVRGAFDGRREAN
jgi:hypothetical protein